MQGALLTPIVVVLCVLVAITAIAGNVASLSSWTVLPALAGVSSLILMWRWNAPRQTTSEAIQETRR